jgi:hypothetical protein
VAACPRQKARGKPPFCAFSRLPDCSLFVLIATVRKRSIPIMKEPGLDGRHRDKTFSESGGNSAKAQRHTQQKFAEADSSVFSRDDVRRDEGKNRQG